MFDQDNSGYLTADEIKVIFGSNSVDQKKLDIVLKQVSKDGSKVNDFFLEDDLLFFQVLIFYIQIFLAITIRFY